MGYPSLSDFIGSDAVFFIFRRFNALAARNLLYMQDELCELEEKLRIIDEADFHTRTSNSRWGLGSRRHDTNTERRLIMKDIESRLKAYRMFAFISYFYLLRSNALVSLPRKSALGTILNPQPGRSVSKIHPKAHKLD